MSEKTQRVLLTGGSGFVGGKLLHSLSKTHEVFCLGRGRVPSQNRVTWLKHDLSRDKLPDSLPDKIDSVVHLAQSQYFRGFPEKAGEILNVNVDSTVQLAEWARRAGAKRFILASSGGIYAPSENPVEEESPLGFEGPLSFYLASKHAAENLLRAYADFFSIVILRPFFIYGPGQQQNMLIPRLIQNIRQGNAIELQSTEGMLLNPVHVSDMLDVLMAALRLEQGAIVNVAGPDVLTLKTVANIIGGHLGQKVIFNRKLDQIPAHRIANISRMTNLFGSPKVKFEQGVANNLGAKG